MSQRGVQLSRGAEPTQCLNWTSRASSATLASLSARAGSAWRIRKFFVSSTNQLPSFFGGFAAEGADADGGAPSPAGWLGAPAPEAPPTGGTIGSGSSGAAPRKTIFFNREGLAFGASSSILLRRYSAVQNFGLSFWILAISALSSSHSRAVFGFALTR